MSHRLLAALRRARSRLAGSVRRDARTLLAVLDEQPRTADEVAQLAGQLHPARVYAALLHLEQLGRVTSTWRGIPPRRLFRAARP